MIDYSAYIDESRGNIVVRLLPPTREETEVMPYVQAMRNFQRSNEFSGNDDTVFTDVRGFVKKKFIKDFSGSSMGQDYRGIEENKWKDLRKGNTLVEKVDYIEEDIEYEDIIKDQIKDYLLDKVLELIPEDTGLLAKKIEDNSEWNDNELIVGSNGDASVSYWEYLEHRFFTSMWPAKFDRMKVGAGKSSEVMPPLKTALERSRPFIDNIMKEASI